MTTVKILACDRCGKEIREKASDWYAWKHVSVATTGFTGGPSWLQDQNWTGDICPECAHHIERAISSALEHPAAAEAQ